MVNFAVVSCLHWQQRKHKRVVYYSKLIFTQGRKASESRFRLCFCYYYLCFLCSKFPELSSITKPKLRLSLGTKSENLLHHIFSLAFEWSWKILIRKGWIILFFGFFSFYSFAPATFSYIIQTHHCCQSRRSISRVHMQKLLLKSGGFIFEMGSAFSFLLIRPCDLHYRYIVAVKEMIEK